MRAAWGLPHASSKGPKPALTLARIIAAAVDVASVDGMGAVAMSRIAAALGVGTMSLYRYVEGKDELLALMVDAAFAPAPPPLEASYSWRAALSQWAREHLAVLRRHPWVLRVPLNGPPVSPNNVRWFERGLGCLHETRLSEGEKLGVLLLVNGFVRNDALLAADLEAAARGHGAATGDAGPSYGSLLAELVDPQGFPAITALIRSRVFDGPDAPDDRFDFGLERILDGVAALIRDRQT
jgi:AcrR family transcriptional regulator